MSKENVEIVRRGLEAYARGDMDVALAAMDPDVIWNPFEEEQTYGVEGVREHLERWESTWDDLVTTPEEFVDAGDSVLVTIHFRGRGREGVVVNARSYAVYKLRDGKMVRMDEFMERDEALAVAGLAEHRQA